MSGHQHSRLLKLFFVFIIGMLSSEAAIAVCFYTKNNPVSESVCKQKKKEKEEDIALIRARTSIADWEYVGRCQGGYDEMQYKLTYYKTLGILYPDREYGILHVQYDKEAMTWYGYDFNAERRQCVVDGIKDVLILDRRHIRTRENYIIALNVAKKNWRIFRYHVGKMSTPHGGDIFPGVNDTKHIYQGRLTDKLYLIAGFGVCPVDMSQPFSPPWPDTLFCHSVGWERFKQATDYLKAETGFDLFPHIFMQEMGVFRFYPVCSACEAEAEDLIARFLGRYGSTVRARFNNVVDKKDDKYFYYMDERRSLQDMYSALLAADSFIDAPFFDEYAMLYRMILRINDQDFIRKLEANRGTIRALSDAAKLELMRLKVLGYNPKIESAFQRYWNIIYGND